MDLIFSNEWLQLFRAENENGEQYQFTKDSDKVIVLPYHFINQKPHIITLIEPVKLWGRQKELTCVTGTLDEGENERECAVRELEEETGVVCPWGDEWDYIGRFNFNKGSVDERHLFLVDVTGKEIRKKTGDGSWFEKNTQTLLSDFKVTSLSTDIYLHFLIEKLKNKLNDSNEKEIIHDNK